MLNILAKEHKKWIKIVQSLGGGDFSEDIVQEMYLKLTQYHSENKAVTDGKINVSYVFLTLKSITFTLNKIKKRYPKVDISEIDINKKDFCCYIDDISKLQADENLRLRLTYLVNEEEKNWHWYDQQIFDLYKNEKTSIRKLAKKTDISWVSIFLTIKTCKEKIRQKLGKNYRQWKKDLETQ